MTNPETTPEFTLKSTQIIALGLIAGVVSTIGIVIFLITNEIIGVTVQGQTVSLVMAGITLAVLCAVPAIPRLISKPNDPEKLLLSWQQQVVIQMALIEGAALSNAVACLVERHWWSFALMLGTLGVMLWKFPTRSRFEQFLEAHKTH